MATNKELGINVIKEIERKVSEELRIRLDSDPSLSDIAMATLYDTKGPNERILSESRREFLETMETALFYGIGSVVMADYARKGIKVTGQGYIRSLLDMAEMSLVIRESNLESGGNVHIPQIGDREISDRIQGSHSGMSIRTTPGAMSEEDFRFGYVPTQGGARPLGEIQGDISQERTRLNSAARMETLERKYGKAARRFHNYGGKSTQDILNSMERKYVIQGQTYALDVEGTLKAAGLDRTNYNLLNALESERDNPAKRDELQQMYSMLELKKIRDAASGEDYFAESDD